MKKILFIQNNGSTSGGVWSVNSTLAYNFKKIGFQVKILSVREEFNKSIVQENIETDTINKTDSWNVGTKKDILKNILKLKFKKALTVYNKIKKRKKDILKLNDYILDYNPNYIIATHYQLIDGIPESYLKKTFNVHHQSFKIAQERKANIKTFLKYNNKTNYCWLSKKSMECASLYGLNNNYYAYNPVKFNTIKTSKTTKNKKLIVITRFVEEKRIELMIKLVEKIFQDKQFSEWSFDIYGTGELENNIKQAIKNSKQIKFKGKTSEVEKAYMTSSINLNTSLFEGFPMSILESSECGVPTISFNYGEAVFEQIKDGVTGYIIDQNNQDLFIKKLTELMKDKNKLENMSKNCKKYNEIFSINKVIEHWLKLFNEIDNLK